MRAKDRELLNEETGRCLETLLFRVGQVKQIYPWLRPHLSHAELRRAVARLRSGKMLSNSKPAGTRKRRSSAATRRNDIRIPVSHKETTLT